MTIPIQAAAATLDVHPVTVRRWRVATGRTHRGGLGLTDVDMMVARAVRHLTGHPAGHADTAERREVMELAVRRRPRRWICVTAGSAETFDDAPAAAAAWLARQAGAATLIDLAPRSDVAAAADATPASSPRAGAVASAVPLTSGPAAYRPDVGNT